jgi:hypothetical protein
MKDINGYRKTTHGLLMNAYHAQKKRVKERGLPPVGYTFSEFEQRYSGDKKFLRVYDEWVKSNYQKDKKPSFDRINRKKTYTLDNITCMTWAENRYKQRMEAKICKIKRVCAVKDNEIVSVYFSVSDAARKLGGSQSLISRSLSHKNLSYLGYQWYSEEEAQLLKTKRITADSLHLGARIWFDGETKGYTVKAFDSRYAICTKPFNPKRTVLYTIIDFRDRIRGRNNLIFNSYDYKSQEDIDRCLNDLSDPINPLQVSGSHHVTLNIVHISAIDAKTIQPPQTP